MDIFFVNFTQIWLIFSETTKNANILLSWEYFTKELDCVFFSFFFTV